MLLLLLQLQLRLPDATRTPGQGRIGGADHRGAVAREKLRSCSLSSLSLLHLHWINLRKRAPRLPHLHTNVRRRSRATGFSPSPCTMSSPCTFLHADSLL